MLVIQTEVVGSASCHAGGNPWRGDVGQQHRSLNSETFTDEVV